MFVLTELAVVLGLDALGLAFAALLGRWALGRSSAGAEARRLVNATTRAAEAFLWRAGKRAALGTAGVILLVLGVHGARVLRRAPSASLATGLWTAFAIALGASLAFAVAYLTMALSLRAALRIVRATQAGLDQGATLALRASGAAAVSAEALSAASVAALLGLLYLLGGGGTSMSPTAATLLFERAVTVLPGLCLGSVIAALVLGLGGAAYQVSSGVAALGAAGLEPADPRNPAMVASLVGEHVGTGVRRSVDMFAATTLANVATVTLGVAAFRMNAGASGGRAWALVTLPLVVRAVGGVAAAFGLLTARGRESERAVLLLWRGQVTAAILLVGGLTGAALWLVGSPAFSWFAAAGASGVATSAALGHLARRQIDRRFGPVQDLLEAARAGPAPAVARGLALGLRGAWVPVVLLGLSLGSAYHLGERAGLPGAGLLATATCLAGLFSAGAYLLALGLFEPIVTTAIAIGALEPDANRPELRRRAAQLDDAGFEGARVAEPFFISLGCGASLIAGLSVPLVVGAGSIGVQLSLAKPAVVWSGALGAATVVALSGRALSIAARATRAAVAEVDRQLRAFPREAGVVQAPDGYTPSYRTLIELAGRVSLEGLAVPLLVAIAAPTALGFGLRVLYTSPGLAAEGLTSFVVTASATGLGMALATDGASAVLKAAHRESRPRGSASTFEASLVGHQIGRFMGDMAAPAAHLLVKTFAAAALVIAPLLAGP
jgi:K(+)-stimulated pyrophosphate-energized sodium pump